MFKAIAHVRFKTHQVTISQNEQGRVHLFKYSDRGCDFEEFDDMIAAGDWILEPLSDIVYRITFEGEVDDWTPSIVHPHSKRY